MSSSTRMNGATIPRASQARTAKETRTMAASQAHGGTARRRSATKLDLGEPPRQIGRLGRVGLDADRRGRTAHLAEHRVRDRCSAGSQLERGGIAVGNAVEVVLREGELRGGGAHG